LLETRVTGKSEIWQCLRNACEADEGNHYKKLISLKRKIETACAIITTMDIKLVNYSLQAAYDNLGTNWKRYLLILKGNLYDVPIFCINDPIEYDLPEKINLQKEELSGETIKVNS